MKTWPRLTSRRARKIREAVKEAQADLWAAKVGGRLLASADGYQQHWIPFTYKQRMALLKTMIRMQTGIWGTPFQKRFWDYSPTRLQAYMVAIERGLRS